MSDAPAPRQDAASLRAAGRAPDVPFSVELADGRVLEMQHLLRVLPGKRVVGEATLEGKTVLAKLFVGAGSERHWQRELNGIERLQAGSIPTPKLHAALALAGGGHALLTDFFADAVSLAGLWQRLGERPLADVDDSDVRTLLVPAVVMLARMHRAGLAQADLHPGNFLRLGEHLLVIDGDSVSADSQPLSAAAAAANLGMLLAQLPAAWDERCPALLAAYLAAKGIPGVDKPMLRNEIDRVRRWRVQDYLAKCGRDCTLFQVERRATRFSSVVRAAAGRLRAVLPDPDLAIESGERLKSGNTCTVAQTGDLVIKRYNLKGIGHALSRLWRPSRAWHSWREGHRLRVLGIPTPAPLAVVEERFGPLRRRAWLVNEFCPGISLAQHLSPDREPPPAEAAAIVSLFSTLHRLRISHGDLKASNLLWHDGRVWLIDLDAVTAHRSDVAWRKAWRRDRGRLLRNWPADSALGCWLQRMLPPA